VRRPVGGTRHKNLADRVAELATGAKREKQCREQATEKKMREHGRLDD
jgi:hypothetical protein